MKKRAIILLAGLFLLSAFFMPLAEAKAFTWSIFAVNHNTVGGPTAALGHDVNISSVWTYGSKWTRACKTSFVTELLRNGAVVSTLRCVSGQGCVKAGPGASVIAGDEWISTGCVQYCYGGCWVGPSKPSPSIAVVADTIRARYCGGCNIGAPSQFQYDEHVDSNDLVGSVLVSDQEKQLGDASGFVGTSGAAIIRVMSTTPGVMLWLGDQDTYAKKETTNTGDMVWACADFNQNNICDGNEGAAHECLAGGGDWYKGKCCGTDVTGCGYDSAVGAYCGKDSSGDFAWATPDDTGEIHVFDGCQGVSLVSNGSMLFGCGTQVGSVQPMSGFLSVHVGTVTHKYSCANGAITECAGCADTSRCAFSSANAAGIGSRAPGTQNTYYCASDGDWTTDLDSKNDASCTAAGFLWTGRLCCGEADDPGEYYNDPSYPDGVGGCWNKRGIRSGEFAVNDRVINYKGQFFGCRITDPNLLGLQDTHPTDAIAQALHGWVINNSILPCGTVLQDAQPGGLPNAVCQPNGQWQFTNGTFGTYNKSISWAGAVSMTGIRFSGCCPYDHCWNGTSCQPQGAFYRVADRGFRCGIPPLQTPPGACVPSGCIMPACSAKLVGDCARYSCIPLSCFDSMANEPCVTPGCGPANSNIVPAPLPVGGGGAICHVDANGNAVCVA